MILDLHFNIKTSEFAHIKFIKKLIKLINPGHIKLIKKLNFSINKIVNKPRFCEGGRGLRGSTRVVVGLRGLPWSARPWVCDGLWGRSQGGDEAKAMAGSKRERRAVRGRSQGRRGWFEARGRLH